MANCLERMTGIWVQSQPESIEEENRILLLDRTHANH